MNSHSPATVGGRRWTLVKLTAVTAVLATTLIACGTDVELAGQQVDDKVPFLGQIEDQWRNDIATTTVSTSDGAHCWLARQKDGKEFDRKAFCGPVRHLGAEQPGVWDVYAFEASVSGDDVSISDIAIDNVGAAFPADRKAYRGDGAEVPKNADQLAAPKPPPVAKGFATKVQPDHSPKILDATRPANGRIIAPGLELTVSEVGRIDQLGGFGDDGIVGPADGEELRAITFAVKNTSESDWDRTTTNTTPIFSIGTPSGKKFLDLSGDNAAGKSLPTESITVVASVPTDQDSQLTVGVAGLDQTISMKTGDRTSKTAAAYYKSTTNVGLGKQFPSQTVTVSEFQAQHTATFTSADVVPFVADRGWAKQGKVWLKLNYSNATFATVGDRKWWWAAPAFQASKSLVLTDDKGHQLPFTGTLPVSVDGYSGGTGEIVAEIPETAKSVRAIYAPAGTFATEAWIPSGEGGPAVRSGSFQFKAFTFTVAIPQG
jgi:hypothetical protein